MNRKPIDRNDPKFKIRSLINYVDSSNLSSKFLIKKNDELTIKKRERKKSLSNFFPDKNEKKLIQTLQKFPKFKCF